MKVDVAGIVTDPPGGVVNGATAALPATYASLSDCKAVGISSLLCRTRTPSLAAISAESTTIVAAERLKSMTVNGITGLSP
jgi:hypothetical protein